tara:strand:+ start:4459 stop:5352 length:894 start_codon:yes stop_codon:yes gene_type:complete
MIIFNKLIVLILPLMPKWFIKIIAKKYIAGTTLEEAINAIKNLNSQGQKVTLDILGEHTETIVECNNITDDYIRILKEINKNKLDCNISVKPSHIGSDINSNIVVENFSKIQDAANKFDNFIRLDMESSELTDLTLEVYSNLIKKSSNVGIVIQAYLYRSMEDIGRLKKNTNIRLCKGIYNESPEIAIKDAQEINNNYIKLLNHAFDRNIFVGIASHDEKLITRCIDLIKSRNISNNSFEFQYLYGVPMNKMLKLYKSNNFTVRAYVPYGINWYDYSVRRIKENPKIASYVLKNILK